VFRDGLYFKKFTDVPFTGKLTGNPQGSFKNGYQENSWISYYENGQLYYKGNFKNGWLEGAWVWYYDDGQLNNKGNYKKGKRDGAWVYYREDGTVSKLMTGAFKGGVKISD
jgi:antitoxin component YwqK of YwqJK toxin-antitoxin module